MLISIDTPTLYLVICVYKNLPKTPLVVWNVMGEGEGYLVFFEGGVSHSMEKCGLFSEGIRRSESTLHEKTCSLLTYD